MGYSVEGKHVLITGGNAGIGAALAEGLAAAGATVAIVGRRADKLAESLARVQAHSPGSRSYQADLADLDAIDSLAATINADLGGIDVLVNNAGIPKRRKVWDLDAATVEYVNRINYLSPVRLTLALLPTIMERSGRIVNVSSVAARLSPPAEAAYAATKAALTAFSESMYVDLQTAGHDVGVHVVNPGVVDTELFELPDNDPFESPVERLPASAMVEPVLRMLAEGTFEIYVPEWFADVVGHKYPDVGAYLQGSIAWARDQAAGQS